MTILHNQTIAISTVPIRSLPFSHSSRSTSDLFYTIILHHVLSIKRMDPNLRVLLRLTCCLIGIRVTSC